MISFLVPRGNRFRFVKFLSKVTLETHKLNEYRLYIGAFLSLGLVQNTLINKGVCYGGGLLHVILLSIITCIYCNIF